MTKALATTIGLGSLMFNWWTLTLHSAFVGFFYDTHQSANYVRLIVAATVLLYAWLPRTRYVLTRSIIATTGFMLVIFGLSSLVTSQIFGVSYYMLPVDIFLSVEWGIIALIVALEMPVRHINLYQHYIRPLAARAWARNQAPKPSMQALTTVK